MIRIHTGGRVTGVHHYLTRFDGAVSDDVSHAVRVRRKLLTVKIAADVHHPVAAWIPRRLPQPAAVSPLVFGVESCDSRGGQIPPAKAFRERATPPRSNRVTQTHVNRAWIIRLGVFLLHLIIPLLYNSSNGYRYAASLSARASIGTLRMRQIRIGVRNDDNFSPPRIRVIQVRSQPTASASFWSVRAMAFIASATVLNCGEALLLRPIPPILVTPAHHVNKKMCVWVTVTKTHQNRREMAYSLHANS